MDIINLIILGVIQGVTEFLPVSSSGHLVLAQEILGINSPGTIIEVILHFGSLTAILAFYKNDIIKLLINIIKFDSNALKFSFYIVIGIIPAGIAGVFFKDFFITFYNDIFYTSIFLIITGIILFLSKFMEHKHNSFCIKSVFMIGLIQAFSIFPGISRSGMTITTALFMGINRNDAFKFSFFLAIPIILGATILEIPYLIILDNSQSISLFIGFIVSAITGYFALKLLYKIVINNTFWMFSLYCFFIGIIGLVYAR
jgi:undecaprenyl-diphosphatase